MLNFDYLSSKSKLIFLLSALFIFLGSLAVLLIGSNYFIESSERIGLSFGASPFVIGVTILAVGTSLPELSTSILSVVAESSEIVVGNVVGSNITNILLVLGLTALVGGEVWLDRDIMDTLFPLLMGSAFLLWFVLADLHFSLIEAVLFIACLVVFVHFLFRDRRDKPDEVVKAGVPVYLILLLSGIAVYFGAEYTVEGIIGISEGLGINPSTVSLSALALGTSLPEVAVSISASRRGQNAMALGNVLGSNIFNSFAVMAIPSFFGELIIPRDVISFSLPFMIIVSAMFGIVCFNQNVNRWEGSILLIFYIFFLAELIRLGLVQ